MPPTMLTSLLAAGLAAASLPNPAAADAQTDVHSIPWPRGHSWDVPFFLGITLLQYCRLALPLGLVAGAGSVFYVGCLMLMAVSGDHKQMYNCVTFPLLLLPVFSLRIYVRRVRLRELLLAELERTDDQPASLGLLTHGRKLPELLARLSYSGHCRNTWDKACFVLALLSWQELLCIGGLAGWAAIALTPDFITPGAGWPFVDVAYWCLMQAAFAWRTKGWLTVQVLATLTLVVVGFTIVGDWLTRREDLQALSAFREAMKKGLGHANGTFELPIPPQLRRGPYDSFEESVRKHQRLVHCISAAADPASLWEHTALPCPTWHEFFYTLGAGYGALIGSGAVDAVAAPGSPTHAQLTWTRDLALSWLGALRRGSGGVWGVTVVALLGTWGVVAWRTSVLQKAWRDTYCTALWERLAASGRKRADPQMEKDAMSDAVQEHGSWPTTWARLSGLAKVLARVLLGLLWGSVVISWVLYGGSLPAYGVPAFQGVGYSRDARGSAAFAAGGLDGAGAGAGFGMGAGSGAGLGASGVASCWASLRMAARINLLATRAFRAGGLDGVQVAMEALRAARSLESVVALGGNDHEAAAAHAKAIDTLRRLQFRGMVGIDWEVGSEWALGLPWERGVKAAGRGVLGGGVAGQAWDSDGVDETGKRLEGMGGELGAPAAPAPPMAKGDAPKCDARWGPDFELINGACTADVGAAGASAGGASGGAKGATRRKSQQAKKQAGASKSGTGAKAGASEPEPKPTVGPKPASNWLYSLHNLSVAAALVLWLAWRRPRWLRSPEDFLDAVTAFIATGPRIAGGGSRGGGKKPAAAGGGASRKQADKKQQKPAASSSSGAAVAAPGGVAKRMAPAVTQKDSQQPAQQHELAASAVPVAVAAEGVPAGKKAAQLRPTRLPPPSSSGASNNTQANPPSSTPATPPAKSAATKAPAKAVAGGSGRRGAAKPAAAITAPGPPAPAAAPPPNPTPADAAAAALADVLPFTATLAQNAAAAPPSPPRPPPPVAAARGTGIPGPIGPPASASSSKPAPTAPTAASTAASTAAAQAPQPMNAGSLFNWARPVVVTAGPPQPPLSAMRMPAAAAAAAAAARPGTDMSTAPAPTPFPSAATATAAAPVKSSAAKPTRPNIPIPIPIPVPTPVRTPTNPAPPPAAPAPAVPHPAAPPPPAATPAMPPPHFLGLNPALAHFLGRMTAAAPASPPPAAATAAASAAVAAAAAATSAAAAGSASTPTPAARRSANERYDTTGLSQLICIRCRTAERDVGYLHGKTAHVAFCPPCAAVAGRAIGELCPLCDRIVEDVVRFKG